MQSPRWNTILFDLDGTLANTIPLIIASYQHCLKAVLGETREVEEVRSWIGRTLTDTFHDIDPERAAELERVYLDHNLTRLATDVMAYDGILDLLDDLNNAGVTMGVVTSKRQYSAELTMGSTKMEGVIALLGTSNDSATHKPSPEPLHNALAKLGVGADGAVYVGDATVDIQAARAAGMDAVAVSWGAGDRLDLVAAQPDALADTADELRAILLG